MGLSHPEEAMFLQPQGLGFGGARGKAHGSAGRGCKEASASGVAAGEKTRAQS